jgi:sec-independent protein translocase protein TatA
MFDFSPIQILIVLAIALLVLGPKRLPQMGRSLGQGLRGFKESITGEDERDEPAATRAHAPMSDDEADEALAKLAPDEAVAAHQATPAPTPEIAEAEVAEERASTR